MNISTVLLIEDNPGDARLVVEYLGDRFGSACSVLATDTLGGALDTLRRQPVDVVLLDLGLPDSSGLDAYFQIQAHAPRTPVVILTGDDNEDQAIEALRIGAEDYLAKHEADSVTLVRVMRHAVQRRQMSERLRDSEARFRAIVETAEEGIVQLSHEGVILLANTRACQMLGINGNVHSGPGLAHNRPFAELTDPLYRYAALALTHTPPGQRASCELLLKRADGLPCWVIAAAGGVQLGDSQAQTVVLLTDITGRKLAELELRSLKDELERRVAERTAQLAAANADLAAINIAMVHDLRNPLNGILGMARLTLKDSANPLPPKAEGRVQMIERSALDMNELITGLLSLAALGRQAICAEVLELSAMAHSIADRLSQANPQRVVHWHIAPEVKAMGDKALIGSVLQNLLENSWKYSAEVAQAHIAFGMLPRTGDGSVYFVRDDGVGFEMDAAADLFQPFRRLPSSKGFAGTGIGLSSVRSIIERHGGKVWAESMPGVQTTFFFTLPGQSHEPLHPAG